MAKEGSPNYKDQKMLPLLENSDNAPVEENLLCLANVFPSENPEVLHTIILQFHNNLENAFKFILYMQTALVFEPRTLTADDVKKYLPEYMLQEEQTDLVKASAKSESSIDHNIEVAIKDYQEQLTTKEKINIPTDSSVFNFEDGGGVDISFNIEEYILGENIDDFFLPSSGDFFEAKPKQFDKTIQNDDIKRHEQNGTTSERGQGDNTSESALGRVECGKLFQTRSRRQTEQEILEELLQLDEQLSANNNCCAFEESGKGKNVTIMNEPGALSDTNKNISQQQFTNKTENACEIGSIREINRDIHGQENITSESNQSYVESRRLTRSSIKNEDDQKRLDAYVQREIELAKRGSRRAFIKCKKVKSEILTEKTCSLRSAKKKHSQKESAFEKNNTESQGENLDTSKVKEQEEGNMTAPTVKQQSMTADKPGYITGEKKNNISGHMKSGTLTRSSTKHEKHQNSVMQRNDEDSDGDEPRAVLQAIMQKTRSPKKSAFNDTTTFKKSDEALQKKQDKVASKLEQKSVTDDKIRNETEEACEIGSIRDIHGQENITSESNQSYVESRRLTRSSIKNEYDQKRLDASVQREIELAFRGSRRAFIKCKKVKSEILTEKTCSLRSAKKKHSQKESAFEKNNTESQGENLDTPKVKEQEEGNMTAPTVKQQSMTADKPGYITGEKKNNISGHMKSGTLTRSSTKHEKHQNSVMQRNDEDSDGDEPRAVLQAIMQKTRSPKKSAFNDTTTFKKSDEALQKKQDKVASKLEQKSVTDDKIRNETEEACEIGSIRDIHGQENITSESNQSYVEGSRLTRSSIKNQNDQKRLDASVQREIEVVYRSIRRAFIKCKKLKSEILTEKTYSLLSAHNKHSQTESAFNDTTTFKKSDEALQKKQDKVASKLEQKSVTDDKIRNETEEACEIGSIRDIHGQENITSESNQSYVEGHRLTRSSIKNQNDEKRLDASVQREIEVVYRSIRRAFIKCKKLKSEILTEKTYSLLSAKKKHSQKESANKTEKVYEIGSIREINRDIHGQENITSESNQSYVEGSRLTRSSIKNQNDQKRLDASLQREIEVVYRSVRRAFIKCKKLKSEILTEKTYSLLSANKHSQKESAFNDTTTFKKSDEALQKKQDKVASKLEQKSVTDDKIRNETEEACEIGSIRDIHGQENITSECNQSYVEGRRLTRSSIKNEYDQKRLDASVQREIELAKRGSRRAFIKCKKVKREILTEKTCSLSSANKKDSHKESASNDTALFEKADVASQDEEYTTASKVIQKSKIDEKYAKKSEKQQEGNRAVSEKKNNINKPDPDHVRNKKITRTMTKDQEGEHRKD